MNSQDIIRWFKSIVLALGIFILLNLLFFRSTDLFFFNKLFGATAAVLAGITLLAGPLSRINVFFSRFMTIRRYLGLCAFFFLLLHVFSSVFFLPSRFPLSWFGREWIPVAFGVLALLIWIYLAYISRNKKIIAMGVDRWKKHLSIGAKIAYLAIYAHMFILKYGSWIAWFTGEQRRQPYPPLSFFLFLFMTSVIIFRLRR